MVILKTELGARVRWTLENGFERDDKATHDSASLLRNLYSLEAEGVELQMLAYNIKQGSGIPITPGIVSSSGISAMRPSQRWFGDHARYLLANIIQPIDEFLRP